MEALAPLRHALGRQFDFSDALTALKGGAAVGRATWPKWKRVALALGGVVATPPAPELLGLAAAGAATETPMNPHLVVRLIDGSFEPWTPAAGDLLASDWTVTKGLSHG